MKEFSLAFGSKVWEFNLRDQQVVCEFSPNLKTPQSNIPQLIRNALSQPVGYPELKRAITPDDRIAIVLVDQFNGFLDILVAVLEHIAGAGVAMENVTLVCLACTDSDSWVENLPDEYNEIKIEVHNPDNKKSHAFLTSSDEIGKLYLNRTIIEADQIVVLGKRQYDPYFGISGAEADLFPALANSEVISTCSKEVLGEDANSDLGKQQAIKVAWLLGAPYFVQVLEGANGSVEEIFAGADEANRFAEKKLDEIWKQDSTSTFGLVIALVGGPDEKIGFVQLCRALVCAKRIVKKNGVIVLLAQAEFNLGDIKKQLEMKSMGKSEAAFSLVPPHLIKHWVDAASHGKVYVSTFEGKDDIGRLLALPLRSAQELCDLASNADGVAIIRDAHKSYINIKKR